MIDTEAAADYGLPVQHRGSPGKTHTRIEVPIVGLVEDWILRARWRVYRRGKRWVNRGRSHARPVKLIKVENRGAVIRFVSDAIIFPSQAQARGKRRSQFPLVLKVRHQELTAIFMAAPWSRKFHIRKQCRDKA